jgi:hypothetical protein
VLPKLLKGAGLHVPQVLTASTYRAARANMVQTRMMDFVSSIIPGNPAPYGAIKFLSSIPLTWLGVLGFSRD